MGLIAKLTRVDMKKPSKIMENLNMGNVHLSGCV
jgi:hypothetical protein